MSVNSEIEKRLRVAADILKNSTNSDQKKKAKAALALLSISDQVGTSRAAKLIKAYDDLVRPD